MSTDGMLGAGSHVLDVAQHGVDPVELRVRHASTPTTANVALMGTSGLIEGSETSETVTDDLAGGHTSLISVATYLSKGKAAHMAKLNTLRMAFLIGLHSRH